MTLLHLAAGTEGPITRPIRSSSLGTNVSVLRSVWVPDRIRVVILSSYLGYCSTNSL